MSFHYPLHRYFAAFLCQAINVQRVEIEDIIPPPGFLHTLMIHPLHLLVSPSLFLFCSFTATAAASGDQNPLLVQQFNALWSCFVQKYSCRCLSAIIALLDDLWVSYICIVCLFFLFIRQHLENSFMMFTEFWQNLTALTCLHYSWTPVNNCIKMFSNFSLLTSYLNMNSSPHVFSVIHTPSPFVYVIIVGLFTSWWCWSTLLFVILSSSSLHW